MAGLKDARRRITVGYGYFVEIGKVILIDNSKCSCARIEISQARRGNVLIDACRETKYDIGRSMRQYGMGSGKQH